MAYVSADELAAFVEIKTSGRHPELERAIASAQREVDRYCGWGNDGFDQGAASASVRVFEPNSGGTYPLEAPTRRHLLMLPIGSGIQSTSGLVVKTDTTDDGTFDLTWASTDYELIPANNQWGGVDGFPFFEVRAVGDHAFPEPFGSARRQRIQITAKWGWAEVPPDVKDATILRAAQLHHRSRTSDGIQPLTGFRAGGHDRDWQLLLDDYRHPGKRFGVA